jgi:hypothetical protein
MVRVNRPNGVARLAGEPELLGDALGLPGHRPQQLVPDVAVREYVAHRQPGPGAHVDHLGGGRHQDLVPGHPGGPGERDERQHQAVAGRYGDEDLHAGHPASSPGAPANG